MTNNLVFRVFQHKNKLLKGFTNRYNCVKLVYYEIYDDPYSAIIREKQIKAGSRKKKLEMIEKNNCGKIYPMSFRIDCFIRLGVKTNSRIRNDTMTGVSSK